MSRRLTRRRLANRNFGSASAAWEKSGGSLWARSTPGADAPLPSKFRKNLA
jgi:hypothetical protein